MVDIVLYNGTLLCGIDMQNDKFDDIYLNVDGDMQPVLYSQMINRARKTKNIYICFSPNQEYSFDQYQILKYIDYVSLKEMPI